MRQRRVIIFEDEPVVLLVFRHLFEMRDYELMAFTEPVFCPIYGNGSGSCDKLTSCADVLITDHRMPNMSGIELLEEQARRGCRLQPGNKALLSGALDRELIERVKSLGAAAFPKPLEFEEFTVWLEECEQRMDLTVPLSVKRREERRLCREPVQYTSPGVSDVMTGMVLNMSRSGLCLRASEPLPAEGRIHLLTRLPLASSEAEVRWSRESSDGSFLYGLQCR